MIQITSQGRITMYDAPGGCCVAGARNYEQEHGLREGTYAGARPGASIFRMGPLRGTKEVQRMQRRSDHPIAERRLSGPLRYLFSSPNAAPLGHHIPCAL